MIKGSALVRNNVNTTLRGSAQIWYTAELTNLERIGLRADNNGVDAWCSALIGRFKEPSGVALSKLTAEKYTIKNAKNRREPSAYVQAIIRHARAANIDGVLNQLTFAHEGLAPELRVFVDPPSETTSVSNFIKSLDLKKSAWFELHTIGNFTKHQSSHQAPQYDQRSRDKQRQPQYVQQYDQYKPYSPGFNQARPPQFQQQFRPQQRPFQSYQSSQYANKSPYNQAQQQYQPPPNFNTPSYLPRPTSLPQAQQGYQKPFQKPLQRQDQDNAKRFQKPLQSGGFKPNGGYTGYKPRAYQVEKNTEDNQASEENQDGHNQDQEQPMEISYAGHDDYGNEQYWVPDEEIQNQEDESYYHEQFSGFTAIETFCTKCDEPFPSKNKLHRHLRDGCPGSTKNVNAITRSMKASKATVGASSRPSQEPLRPSSKQTPASDKHQSSEDKSPSHPTLPTSAPTQSQSTTVPRARGTARIVESTASTSGLGSGMAFRLWNFASTSVSLDKETFKDFDYDAPVNTSAAPLTSEEASPTSHTGCIDTGCGPTLIDREWLKRQLPDVKIHKMAVALKVRGIGSSRHKTDEYITEPLYFPALSKADEGIIACIRRELHIIDNLRINLLIGNDVLGAEGFVLDMAQGKAYIPGCGATIRITSRPRGQFISRVLHAESHIIVPPRSQRIIPIRSLGLPEDRDFLFEPTTHRKLTFYSHLIDNTTTGVLAQNESSLPIQISKRTKLGEVTEIPSTAKVTHKLGQQYVGPFPVLQKIGRLAYRLDIPTIWPIHPVFTIAQLEPGPPPSEDPFRRPRPDHPDSVHVEGDTDQYKSWELERLLSKRIIPIGRARTMVTQYLARWKGYGPEHDEWLSEHKLSNARELIDDYEQGRVSIMQPGA